MNRNRILALVSVLLFATIIAGIAWLILEFRSASVRASVSSALGEAVLLKVRNSGASHGTLSVPVNASVFGFSEKARYFMEVVNSSTSPGTYYWFVYSTNGKDKYIVISDKPVIVGSGYVPKSFISEPK